MEPINVPSVPKEAFNKDRPISDLVRKQVEHFKHVEEKLPADIRAKIPQYSVVTEDEAARYIGAMTSYLLSRPRPKQVAKKVVPIKPQTPFRDIPPLALAAAAAPARKKSTAKKKFVSKKQTPSTRISARSKRPLQSERNEALTCTLVSFVSYCATGLCAK
jgi:hypothetical protein